MNSLLLLLCIVGACAYTYRPPPGSVVHSRGNQTRGVAYRHVGALYTGCEREANTLEGLWYGQAGFAHLTLYHRRVWTLVPPQHTYLIDSEMRVQAGGVRVTQLEPSSAVYCSQLRRQGDARTLVLPVWRHERLPVHALFPDAPASEQHETHALPLTCTLLTEVVPHGVVDPRTHPRDGRPFVSCEFPVSSDSRDGRHALMSNMSRDARVLWIEMLFTRTPPPPPAANCSFFAP